MKSKTLALLLVVSASSFGSEISAIISKDGDIQWRDSSSSFPGYGTTAPSSALPLRVQAADSIILGVSGERALVLLSHTESGDSISIDCQIVAVKFNLSARNFEVSSAGSGAKTLITGNQVTIFRDGNGGVFSSKELNFAETQYRPITEYSLSVNCAGNNLTDLMGGVYKGSTVFNLPYKVLKNGKYQQYSMLMPVNFNFNNESNAISALIVTGSDELVVEQSGDYLSGKTQYFVEAVSNGVPSTGLNLKVRKSGDDGGMFYLKSTEADNKIPFNVTCPECTRYNELITNGELNPLVDLEGSQVNSNKFSLDVYFENASKKSHQDGEYNGSFTLLVEPTL